MQHPLCRVVLRTFVHLVLVCGAWTTHAVAQVTAEARLEVPSSFAALFGQAVSVSGDTLVIGAPATVAGTPLRGWVGAAHVFRRDAGSGAWILQTTLTGTDDTNEAPRFGASVAIDGDTMVIGAPLADGSFPDTGAAHVYERDAAGHWVHRAAFRPALAQPNQFQLFFGARVAISGATIAVSASRADNPAAGTTSSGAVYLYVRDAASGNWALEQVVRLAIQETGDLFGEDVALDGDTLVVGAPREDSAATGVGGDETDNAVQDSGAAYVFVRSGGGWTRQAYLKASNPGVSDWFGQRVAVSGDRVIIGAPGEDNDDAAADNAGGAYVFARDASTGAWVHEAFLKPTGAGQPDQFGLSVAIAGNTVAIGGRPTDFDRNGLSGAVAWMTLDPGGTWVEQPPLLDVGYMVAMSGPTLVSGSPGETVCVANAGAAYVFVLPDITAPVVSAPPDILDLEASGPLTDVTLGAATVTDDSGEALTATPDDDGPFPLGESVVTWSATDNAGNTGSDTQVVRLVDTTAPVVTAPADIEVDAGNPVDLGEATVIEAVGVQSLANDWPGGDFQVGTTVVTWTATDTSGNVGTDTQLVTVVAAVEPLDLDIDTFRATGRVRVRNGQAVTFTFKVKNQGGNTTDAGRATLVGTLEGVEVYRATLDPITDRPGGPATSGEFPPYVPGPDTPSGIVTWVVTVEDGDADTDIATATTRVVP